MYNDDSACSSLHSENRRVENVTFSGDKTVAYIYQNRTITFDRNQTNSDLYEDDQLVMLNLPLVVSFFESMMYSLL